MSEKNGKSSDLLKKNQEKIRPLFNDALLNYSSKNYNKAIECLEKILKIDPMNSDAWYKLGLNYSSLNNFPKAIECYEKSIEIKPNDAFVLNKLKQCLKKAAEINPGDKTVFNKLLTLENKNKVQYKPEMPDTELKSKKSEKWQKYDQYRKLGKDSMEKHDYQNAIQYFEKSLEISVGTQLGDKEIIENLAISYFKLGVDLKERKDYQNTIKYLYKALEITSKSEKRLQIIDLIADSLILDKAKIHQMIIELSKSHPEITLEKLTEKLKSSEQKNLYEKYSLVLIGDESEKLIERLIEKMVNNREIQAQIKENLVIFKKDSPAEVRMSEHELKKWYDLGMMLFAKKNWIKAIEFFEKVIKIDPNYDKIIWPALGQCYIEIGDFQKSFECAQKALEIDPDSANWMNMGLAYRNLKNLDKAIECFEKTVELAPDFKDAWDILARSYAEKELKTPHKLIKCLENLTRIDPNDRDSWFKLGMCYEVLKDGPNAEKCYLKILKFEPSNEKVISRLIIASEIMGDYKKVVEYSNKFLKTNPNSIEILQYLAIAFDKLNNHKEAVKIFEKLVNLLPDDKILRRNLGLAYAKVGKIKKAVDSFEKAIELDPNFKKAWINLNEAYKKLGDEKRRNKFYNRFKKSIERLNVDIKKQIKIKEEKATGFLDAGNFQES
ncbi:MAG: tetratricopeptide repeat protein, partial [Promethearchaeota archaeon]